ncbi:methyltransferase [Halocatena pleomorpha]|uniref:Methyltransferase n=1 Tax=Halocatena pleomorpha TaxID=1785090 RepID=A0A3P3RAW9_9EURY|nr:methyltransferase [Halocatena pleomorpha]RRJ30078.1 methyltransferase [Halocatena pleomorpha]
MPEPAPALERIRQIGFGFLASKTFLSAVELGVFTELAENPASWTALTDRLDIHPEIAADFLDALVALGLLERNDGVYRNAPDADRFLDRNKATYIGSHFEWANARMYPLFGNLTETLRTGEPQTAHSEDKDVFDELYGDDALFERFVNGMAGMSSRVAEILAESFEWEEYETMCDVGASKGIVPVIVAEKNDHIEATAFDLPRLEPIATEFIANSGVADRVSFHAGDIFEDGLPEHDVFVMGRLLHDFDLAHKRELIQRAHDALPEEGALLVYGTMIDDERRENDDALLMNLYIQVETNGFDYTHEQCQSWLQEAGFSRTMACDLPGRGSIVVGKK